MALYLSGRIPRRRTLGREPTRLRMLSVQARSLAAKRPFLSVALGAALGIRRVGELLAPVR
jgi:hypothetical protein